MSAFGAADRAYGRPQPFVNSIGSRVPKETQKLAKLWLRSTYLRLTQVHDNVGENVLNHGGLNLGVVHPHGLCLALIRLLLILKCH